LSELALKLSETGEILIPLKLKESPRAIKLTRRKQENFLRFYAETPNMTKAAAHVGISREAIYKALDNHPDFAHAFEQLKEAQKDNVREVILSMGSQPTRENFNYTKLFAEAQLPEYKKNAEIAIAIQVNSLQASGELANFVHRLPSEK